MTLKRVFVFGLVLLFPSFGVFAASIPCESLDPFPDITRIDLQEVAAGLSKPLALVNAGDGSGRLFIVEQTGKIKILKDGRILNKPFLDLSDRVYSKSNECGLLGLAFHPRFSQNRRFFVNYVLKSRGLHTVIAEFEVGSDPDQADSASQRVILTIDQPFPNHKGGNLAFGPKDHYLYLGMGDGGSGNDPHNNAQNLGVLLGKMLRIDVDHKQPGKAYAIPKDNPFVNSKGARPEVWSYGMRNPWRWSFDALTGFLYVGDVGQDTREEIDVIEKGKNYGWRVMEGTLCTPGVNKHCDQRGFTLPILDYPRTDGVCVIGGDVYRGNMIPGLCGVYVFGDYVFGTIWGIRYDGIKATEKQILMQSHHNISSFGEDENHELYVLDHSEGRVLKIVAVKTP